MSFSLQVRAILTFARYSQLTEVDNRYFQRITTVCANKVNF